MCRPPGILTIGIVDRQDIHHLSYCIHRIDNLLVKIKKIPLIWNVEITHQKLGRRLWVTPLLPKQSRECFKTVFSTFKLWLFEPVNKNFVGKFKNPEADLRKFGFWRDGKVDKRSSVASYLTSQPFLVNINEDLWWGNFFILLSKYPVLWIR